MHIESYKLMENAIRDYVIGVDKKSATSTLNVLDVGSFRVGKDPTYKELMPVAWKYTGLDIEKGDNVDVVAISPTRFGFERDTFDLVISGQTLEHVEFPELWVAEIFKVLKAGGRAIIIAPSAGKIHYRPDYRRILPDGMESLFKRNGFINVVVTLSTSGRWQDCLGTGIQTHECPSI
jgi:SAM-dependent methyltransferase